ncbi:nucleoside 2-deoxyribosyltransferase [Streptomyces goshikiensis]|uniref:nucleoside 2-deoxyribosyltransferase n=1 Tax=Streptomyces goshikiensis TaxID=1942 RepID=UPI00365D3D4D
MYYVAHRLFAAHDRGLGALVARKLADKAGHDAVFLPFCDTDEEALVAPVKGLRLFELDQDRLRTLTGMIAVLHGPSLDDGVCMEIGYASALGVPVVVVTTDFQTYSAGERTTRWEFPDPLVETLATRIIRVDHLGEPEHIPDRFDAFIARNAVQVELAATAAVNAVLTASQGPRPLPVPTVVRPGTVFLEPSPYAPHPAALHEVARAQATAVMTPSRFTARDSLASARSDWDMALRAESLVLDVSGPETPPGAALLTGAAAALGRKVAAFQPRPTYTHAHGREPNWRNLMIQYGTRTHLGDPQALADWLAS